MIEYKIIIQQYPDGAVGLRCETPPGTATLAEQDMARAFMETVKLFARQQGAITTQDWKGTNDPKRN